MNCSSRFWTLKYGTYQIYIQGRRLKVQFCEPLVFRFYPEGLILHVGTKVA